MKFLGILRSHGFMALYLWGLQGPGPREGGAAQVASEARQLAGSDGLASLGLGLGLAGFP